MPTNQSAAQQNNAMSKNDQNCLTSNEKLAITDGSTPAPPWFTSVVNNFLKTN